MNPRHYELHCATLKPIHFEMEEVFMRSIASFVVARRQSVLNDEWGTVSGASCYAFSRFPLSKSPEK
jgi:hypothetical protein